MPHVESAPDLVEGGVLDPTRRRLPGLAVPTTPRARPIRFAATMVRWRRPPDPDPASPEEEITLPARHADGRAGPVDEDPLGAVADLGVEAVAGWADHADLVPLDDVAGGVDLDPDALPAVAGDDVVLLGIVPAHRGVVRVEHDPLRGVAEAGQDDSRRRRRAAVGIDRVRELAEEVALDQVADVGRPWDRDADVETVDDQAAEDRVRRVDDEAGAAAQAAVDDDPRLRVVALPCLAWIELGMEVMAIGSLIAMPPIVEVVISTPGSSPSSPFGLPVSSGSAFRA